jgi:hypothetical protein
MMDLKFFPNCNGIDSYLYSSVFMIAILIGLRLKYFGWYSLCVNLLPFASAVYMGLFARNLTTFMLGDFSANLFYLPLYVTMAAYALAVLFHVLEMTNSSATKLTLVKVFSFVCSASFFLTAIDMCVLPFNDFKGG